MIDERLVEAAAAGARRAGVHALRAASEIVAAFMAFAEEIGSALTEDEGVEHIPVESDDEAD